MRRPAGLAHHVLAVALGLTALALGLVVAVPHQHDPQAASAHPAKACQACKLQDSLASDAPLAAHPQIAATPAARLALAATDRPQLVTLVLSRAPRSPPAIS